MADDDEGGDDFGDYEGDDPVLDGEILPADEVPDDDSEVGLDEQAAGTDDDSEKSDDEDGATEAQETEARTEPQRTAVDPIVRVSNRSRTVVVVPDEERITDSRLHKPEAAYIIAMRAQQIAKFATCFTECGGLHDPVARATKELLDRRCPLRLRREVGTGPNGELLVEEWDVRTMTYPPLPMPTS